MNYDEKFFTQITVRENINLKNDMKEIIEIVSKVVEVDVVSIEIINSGRGISREDLYLSGKKAKIKFKVKEKILYSSKNSKENLHIIEGETFYNEYITLPNKIEGTNPEILLQKKLLEAKILIEDIYIEVMDIKTIYINIFMIAEINVLPTYELCYCVLENKNNCKLYLSYDNGKNPKKISNEIEQMKIKKIQWTDTIRNIVFIANIEGENKLFSLDKNNKKIRCLTIEKFNSVNYFDYNSKKNLIVFSAKKYKEENIFLMNIDTLNCKKLTSNKSEAKNFNPKISFDGNQIGFIKCISGVNNLYVINLNNLNNLNIKKVTQNGYLKSFQWLNKKNIIYVHGNALKKDRINIVNIDTLAEKELIFSKQFESLKNLKVSPNKKYICYVNRTCASDYIYVYDKELEKNFKLTDIDIGNRVYDLIWKIDSTQIYYSLKNNEECSINSINISDFNKKSLISYKNAYKIKLAYRAKIN